MPRIVGGQVVMPADLRRLHKYMLEIEGIDHISDSLKLRIWPFTSLPARPSKSLYAFDPFAGTLDRINSTRLSDRLS